MKKYYYKFCSYLYLILRNVKNKQFNNSVKEFYIQNKNSQENFHYIDKININGNYYDKNDNIEYYYGENLSNKQLKKNEWKHQPILENNNTDVNETWWDLIFNSKVPNGYLNTGLYQTAFCLEKKVPVLSSWIWTSAAIGRLTYEYNYNEYCIEIADIFISLQKEDGGWIVRNDQDYKNILPAYAPNDSSYIARHSLLNAFKLTKDLKYLIAAEECANWVIDNTNKFGLVPTNIYNVDQNMIVDIGFTMSLFSELYVITKDKKYFYYLQNFSDVFIDYFYDDQLNLFSTSIDNFGNKAGGYFSRGQAWALEGLIDAYKVIRSEKLFKVIESNINELVDRQNKDGGWNYNFSRQFLGIDNKGIAIIGNVIADWFQYTTPDNRAELIKAATKALKWCKLHTKKTGVFKGAIFGFCFEGAITKFFCTETAFLYSNAYALLLEKKLLY